MGLDGRRCRGLARCCGVVRPRILPGGAADEVRDGQSASDRNVVRLEGRPAPPRARPAHLLHAILSPGEMERKRGGRRSEEMTIRRHFMRRVAMGIAATAMLAAPWATARGEILDPSDLDHLKCYRIKDALPPIRYRADLRNQFGLEPGCVIATPARMLCVETEKRITSSPLPPGGGPSGEGAGHFLCYLVRCPTSSAPPLVGVEDQFGRRRIQLDSARMLCAPANKLVCGDGEIDPGEACDPGGATTNVCPDGSPCSSDCRCPPEICCQCLDTCTVATAAGCPTGCTPVTGATCNSAGVCETCPCGTNCIDTSGNVGICRDPGSGVCECFVAEPCPCGRPCDAPDGQAGHCRPSGSTNLCQCRPDEPPDCPCGATCSAAGVVGVCQEVAGSTECECRPVTTDCPCGDECETRQGPGHCSPTDNPNLCVCQPDDAPDCPCGFTCTLADGTVGFCRQVPGTTECECRPAPSDCPCGERCRTAANERGLCQPTSPGDVCECRPLPSDCPCGEPCQDGNGQTGTCRDLPGTPAGVCTCFVPPDSCQCGKPCTGPNGEPGRCRPTRGGPGCLCVTG